MARSPVSFFASLILFSLPFTVALGLTVSSSCRSSSSKAVVNLFGAFSAGQSGALRHGISKALQLFDPALRPALKSGMTVNFSNRFSVMVSGSEVSSFGGVCANRGLSNER